MNAIARGPIFDVGQVSYPVQPPHGLLFFEQLWAFIDLHASGQWGNRGQIDYAPLSVEDEWLIDMLPTPRRNSASVLQGRGPIISEYDLPLDVQDKYRKAFQSPEWKNEIGTLKVWTLLSPGASRTLVKLGPKGLD